MIQEKTPRRSKSSDKELTLRNKLWPKLDEGTLFVHYDQRGGYTDIPRTMPFIMQILDDLSNGKPVSAAYLDIWCRDFHHHSFAILNNPHVSASVSGFRGERGQTAWKERLNILKKLGFIDTQPGPGAEHRYILIYNPHLIIRKIFQRRKLTERESAAYNALCERALEVGITDFD
jgi:hypothetical protein